jgi:hypothetical protein
MSSSSSMPPEASNLFSGLKERLYTEELLRKVKSKKILRVTLESHDALAVLNIPEPDGLVTACAGDNRHRMRSEDILCAALPMRLERVIVPLYVVN